MQRLFAALFLLVQSCVAFAIEPPQNLSASILNPTQVEWNWDWPSGAVRFEVTVDGQYKGETNENRYVSNNLWPGDHSMTVKAIDQNGRYSDQSLTGKVNTNNASAAAPATQNNDKSNTTASNRSSPISTPQNLRAEEIDASTILWHWDWIPGAVSYEVTVDGSFAGSASEPKFYSQNMWVGDHSITVQSVNAEGVYSEASDTLKYYFQGNASNTNVAPPPPQTTNSPVAISEASVPTNDNGPIDPASYTYSEVFKKDGYELAFSDEFNGSALNPSRWNSQLRWDGEFNGERKEYRVINGESQFYVNTLADDPEHQNLVASQHNPFEFDGSRLAIRAVRNPLKTNNNNNGHGALRDMVAQQEFLSGAITTYDKFTQKYGYFEARIKIPSHVGTFPAFWLHHQKRKYEGTKRSEIDIMENLGHAPWYVYNSFHYFENVSATYGGDAKFLKPQPEGQIYNGTDFSNDYHTYAVEWSPGTVTWFIDGEKVSQLNNGAVDYEELYVILNLAMGGFWTNYPASSGGLGRPNNEHFPTQSDVDNFANPALEIDYVRVYKRK